MKKREIVVVAFIYNDKNEFLAAQRSDNKKYFPSMWEIVGGRTDFGEDPALAVKREVKEELGIDIKVENPFQAFSFVLDKDYDAVEIVYFAKMIDPNQEVKIKKDEIQNYKWMSEDEFKDYYDKSLPEFKVVEKGFRMIKNICQK